MNPQTFLALLNMFVDEEWSNSETYNTFIRGFGENFDDFTPKQSVNFARLLVTAGINQSDIVEAVIEKFLVCAPDLDILEKRALFADLVSIAVQGDITSNPAVE